MGKHTFHKENCQNCIRRSVIDPIGRRVVLSGIHAFEWSISVIEENRITTMTYPTRVKAIKEFKKYRVSR